MTEFIFMLTRDDRTVANALAAYDEVRTIDGLRYVGFKDVGVPFTRLRRLCAEIRSDGREALLEVVSENKEDELRSIAAARELGVDWVLGGTHVDDALRLLAGSTVRYCPFPGHVVGHPSLLRGSIDEIAASAADLTSRPGVHGLDLLAYRYDGDVEALVRAVLAASRQLVIAAGSVNSPERVTALCRLGVWGFTIGGAIFDGRLPGAPSLRSQVEAVLAMIQSASD